MDAPADPTDFATLILERAMAAYHQGAVSPRAEGLRQAGALLSFDGIAKNGGLVGGGIENCFHTDDDGFLNDALAAYRWFGLGEIARLIETADREYRRFRPTGYEEISDADAALWEELDDRYFETADDEVINAALRRRSGDLLE